MLQSFNRALDTRLANLNLSAAAQKLLENERSKLAGADVSQSPPETRASLQNAIAYSFLHAFRRVMLIGTALTAASAVTAWILIEARPAAMRRE